MISKRVFIAAKNDNYARLAAYIAAGPSDEKCLMNWCAGMLGGEDYAEGMAEALDVQARNTRAASKSYHLVISFRPEDEAKLTPEVFKAIEERFASALGYTDHQRHCGAHKNTGNLHMHVAYNMIHPEKYTCHKEFRDFWVRDKVCRAIEREFGLTVDNGIEHTSSDRQRINDKAQLVEVHTGQQSFDSYAKEHRQEILRALEAATSWQVLHTALAEHGMEIKKYGNGLVIKDRHSKKASHAIKASALDRSLSMKRLEAQFGSYQPPQAMEYVQERTRYVAAPLHRSPERGQLFAKYQAGIAMRKTRLQAVKEQEDATLAAIRAEWAAKRQELERKNIAKKNLRRLIQLARKHEAEAIARAKQSFQEPRNNMRQEVPFTSWNGFLQHKAEQGNEIALAVLRSWHNTVEPEVNVPTKDWSAHGQDFVKIDYLQKERAVLEHGDLTTKAKRRLQAILRMEQVTFGSGKTNVTHRIDKTGTVIFSLSSGGAIRDSGSKLFFSPNNKEAEALAMQYARKKWGKKIHLNGNEITHKPSIERQKGMER